MSMVSGKRDISKVGKIQITKTTEYNPTRVLDFQSNKIHNREILILCV